MGFGGRAARGELLSTPLPRPGRGGNRASSPCGSSIGTGCSRARRAVAVANGQVEVDEAKDCPSDESRCGLVASVAEWLDATRHEHARTGFTRPEPSLALTRAAPPSTAASDGCPASIGSWLSGIATSRIWASPRNRPTTATPRRTCPGGVLSGVPAPNIPTHTQFPKLITPDQDLERQDIAARRPLGQKLVARRAQRRSPTVPAYPRSGRGQASAPRWANSIRRRGGLGHRLGCAPLVS